MAEDNLSQKVEKIEQVEKVGTTKPAQEISAADELSSPTKVRFDDAMDKADTRWSQVQHQAALAANDTASPSPIDMLNQAANKTLVTKVPTAEGIVTQSQDLRNIIKGNTQTIEQAQTATPSIQLSAAQEAIANDKLIHVDYSLRTALSQTGVEVTAASIAPKPAEKPLVKFLGMLTNSDTQLRMLVNQIDGLQSTKNISPATLLAVQIKLNFVQQQLEFFTNVINQAVQGTKTIMNVQV
ncbi:MAG: hypothetical protein JSR46_04740 [Verrucomicrobia bacterium]|nr:hypothetical protein [Verrucomicrobiota bacterium]